MLGRVDFYYFSPTGGIKRAGALVAQHSASAAAGKAGAEAGTFENGPQSQ